MSDNNEAGNEETPRKGSDCLPMLVALLLTVGYVLWHGASIVWAGLP